MKRKWNHSKSIALLTLTGVLLLSGCSGGNGNGNDEIASSGGGDASSGSASPSGSAANTGDASADPGLGDTSPITFSFFGGDASPNWNNMQDDVGKMITEKTGVTLNAEFDVGSGDAANKIALMAASGQYPDLIYAKGDLGKLIDAGAIIDMTDLIDQYAPHIKAIIGDQMNRLRYSNEDTAIYSLPSNTGINGQSFDAGGGFEVQLRVLKELGYPQIKTVQDFENVLKEYVSKHPTTDGQPTIPLLLNADDWKSKITVTNPAFLTTGAPDDGEFYIDPQTYEAELHYFRPEEKEYFRWLNHMYNEGLLDKDTFVEKEDQYQAKISSGRVLGLTTQGWEINSAVSSLKSAGKGDYLYGHFPVTLNDQYQDHSFQQIGIDAWGISITKACKDPIRAIKFLDWLSSDEGQVLINWGIEGKQYTVENGQRVIPADVQDKKTNDNANFTKQTGIGLYWPFGLHYGDGVKDPSGNYYTTNFPEQIQAAYTDAEKEALKGYNITTWKDLFPDEKAFPVKEWGAAYNMQVPTDGDFQVISQKVQDIVYKRIPQAILAKPEEFDKVFDDFLAELDKAGAKKMEAQYTDLIKARVRLFTGKDVK